MHHLPYGSPPYALFALRSLLGRRLRRVKLLVAAAAFLTLGTGLAQSPDNFPNRPIRIIVPFAAGGPADLIARTIAPGVQQRLKQPVIVENRTGAGGIVGAELVAKAAPDGHTLLLCNVGDTIEMSLHKSMPYNFERAFVPVSMLVATPFVLLANPAMPARDMKELLKLARAKPGYLTFGSAGIGVGSHLAGELLKQLANIELTHVPYKGQAAAMNDLLGGQISLLFGNPVTSLPFVRSGKLRALAVTGKERLAVAPDIPTLAESGVPGFDAGTWFGICAPADTPEPIVNRLSASMAAALKEASDRFVSQGAVVIGNTPAEFGRQIQADIAKWRKVVSAAKIPSE